MGLSGLRFQLHPDGACFISALLDCLALGCLGSKSSEVDIKFPTA